MKNLRNFLFHAPKFVSAGRCLLFSLLAYQAGAQTTQWWDNNGASAATSGTWDTTTPNWANSATLTASTVPFTNGNFAIFAAGSTPISALTITVPGAVSCEGLGDATTSTGTASGAPVTNLTFSGAGSINLPSGSWPIECGVAVNNLYINVPITGPGGFVQHNNGALYLYGTNTYSGGTWLTGGQLLYYNNGNSFGTGPITNTGTMSILTTNSTANIVNLPNEFVINNAGGVFNFGDGNTICSGSWTLQATPQLKNNGTGTPLTISGAISSVGGDYGLNLQCDNAGGTITLSGPNTYTGPTGIGVGAAGATTIVNVSSINSVSGGNASSSLGAPITVANGTIAMGNTTYAGEMIYTGAGETSDRVINLTGTTGGAIIEMDGAGPLVFTSDLTASSNGVKIVTLQGSSTATNTFAGAIVNSTSTTGVNKAQAGTWVLTGASTYTGPTTNLGPGLLSVNSIADSGTPNAIGYGAILCLTNGAIFQYTGSGAATTTARTLWGGAGSTDTIDIPATAGNLSWNGPVKSSATFTLNKTNGGTLILGGTADNSFLAMNVNGGTVVLNKASTSSVHALGEASSVGNGGTLQLGSSSSGLYQINNNVPVTVNNGGIFDLNGQSDNMSTLTLSDAGSGSGALINSAPSTTSTLTNAVTLAASATIGGGGNITLSGAVGGNLMPLTYAGSAQLTLQGTNTYTGGTIVSSGTLDINGLGSVLGNVTVSGTGTLELDNNTALSSVATLSVGAGTTVNLNFAGNQTIGALVLGGVAQPAGTYNAAALGAAFAGATYTGGGSLVVSATYWDAGLSGALPGSGGTGSWDSTSTNWFTGADTAWPLDGLAFFEGTAGTVTLNASLNADGLTFTTPGYMVINTDGVSVLTLDGATPTITLPVGNTTIECTIAESGANPVSVNGPGTLTLSGANTYAGGTTINGAVLSVNTIADANCSIGPAGALILNGGSTLSYTGAGPATTARNTMANGAATSTINVPAGSLTANGQIKSGVGSTGQIYTKTGAGTLIMGGSADNAGATMAINQGGVIIAKTSASTAHGLGGGTSTVGTGTPGNNAELQLAGSGNFDLYSGCVLTVNGVDGLLDLNGQSDSFSTLTLSGAGPYGTGVLINSNSATTSAITNGGSGVVLAGNTTIGGSGNIILASKITGAYSLTYDGSATLSLSNASTTYSGGTVINSGGTVFLTNSAAAAGTGMITDNGTLDVAILGNNVILHNAISGPGIVNMIETANNNLQLGGSMAGFTGTINCPASASTAKVQILTTAVGLTSAAIINVAAGGTLYVANAGVTIPGPVNLGGVGNSEVYGALRLESGALVSGPVTLGGNSTTGNGQANTATISGSISDGGHGYALTKTATQGTIVLSGTNTYTGPTTNLQGTLSIGGGGCLGVTATSTNYVTNIVNNGIFNYASSAAQTLSGVISGTGALAQSGPGVLTLTGSNSYTGPTVITNGGTLLVAGGGCLGVTATTTNYAGNITNSGTFAYASSAAQTLSGVISGTGALTDSGSGTLTLSGLDSYTGATLITNGGTLALAGGGSINSSTSLSIAAGAILDVSAYSAYTLGGGTTLKANGTGIGVGTTAATIKGNSGGTVSLGAQPIALTFTPQTFAGDATHPALYVSQGALTLGANAITVNNAGASPLGVGTYSLIQVAGGSITTNAIPTVNVTGNGLAAGTATTISTSGGSVNLVVASAIVPVPAINSVTISGSNMIFSGTNGSLSGTYHVLTSTNVMLPLSQWTSIATNSFGPTGTFSVTNAVGMNPNQFFTIVIP